MSKEAMKLALEALEWNLPVIEDYGDKEQLNRQHKSIAAIYEALAEQPAQQEPVAWKSAAIRLGEELSSVGPDGYYDMTAEQWLDWAMDQRPHGKNSLPAQRDIRNATLDEIATKIEAMPFGDTAASFAVWIREQKT